MKKVLSILLCLVMAACLFAACKTQETGLIKVGIINMEGGESGYRNANIENLAEVFTEAKGYDAKFTNNNDNDAQINAAKQYIQDGVKYLLIAAQATKGWDGVLGEAKEAGVKVLLFDRMIDCDKSLYEAAVVSDMPAEGAAVVAWLKALNLDEYNVLHIKGAPGSDAQLGRSGALEAEAAANDKWNIVYSGTGGDSWSDTEAEAAAKAAIDAGKDFNVLYAENTGMCAGALRALDEANISYGVGGKVTVVAFDADKWALVNVAMGRWNFIKECSPRQAVKLDEFIKALEAGNALSGLNDDKILYSVEQNFEAGKITKADIDTYGLGKLEGKFLEDYNTL